jgi:hypothetical protein
VALGNRSSYGIRRNAMEAISTEVEKQLPTFADIWPLIANTGIRMLRECSTKFSRCQSTPSTIFPNCSRRSSRS